MSSSQLRNWPSSAGRKTANTAAKTNRGSRGCSSLTREAVTRAGDDDWTSSATKTIVRWRSRSSQEMEERAKIRVSSHTWPPAPREPKHDPDGDRTQSSEQTNDHARLAGLRIVGLPRAQGHD